VKGQFTEFQARSSPADGAGVRTVKVASVDTREPQRDEHCARRTSSRPRPTRITFQSTAIRPVDEDTFEIEVTSRSAYHQARDAEAVLEGPNRPSGHDRVACRCRQYQPIRYDMKFNAALGSGNVVVSDKVKILLDISAVKAS